jgi:hypothetical protein
LYVNTKPSIAITRPSIANIVEIGSMKLKEFIAPEAVAIDVAISELITTSERERIGYVTP